MKKSEAFMLDLLLAQEVLGELELDILLLL